jgi:hypothetical protein
MNGRLVEIVRCSFALFNKNVSQEGDRPDRPGNARCGISGADQPSMSNRKRERSDQLSPVTYNRRAFGIRIAKLCNLFRKVAKEGGKEGSGKRERQVVARSVSTLR